MLSVDVIERFADRIAIEPDYPEHTETALTAVRDLADRALRDGRACCESPTCIGHYVADELASRTHDGRLEIMLCILALRELGATRERLAAAC